jgi:hypothetical protein
MAKFIARRPFANVPLLAVEVLRDVEVKEGGKTVKKSQLVKPPGIELGEEFTIGGDVTDLTQLSPQDQTRVRHLLSGSSECAIFMDDPANKGRLETLSRQLVAKKALEAKEAAAAKVPTLADMFQLLQAQNEQITALVAQLAERKKAA